jgi:hypothetical protein
VTLARKPGQLLPGAAPGKHSGASRFLPGFKGQVKGNEYTHLTNHCASRNGSEARTTGLSGASVFASLLPQKTSQNQ